MLTKNPEIFKRIDKIAEHYKNNVANKYLRASFFHLEIDRRDWDNIEALTEKSELFKYQGYHFDDLYLKILSFSRFVHQSRKQILPNAKNYALASIRDSHGGNEKTLAEMAGANFNSNLKVLADLLNDLYQTATHEDTSLATNGQPVFQKMSELQDIGKNLIG